MKKKKKRPKKTKKVTALDKWLEKNDRCPAY